MRAHRFTLAFAGSLLIAGCGLGSMVAELAMRTGFERFTLVDGDEDVRFDVDTEEAQRSGLRFSSKLLRLARTVL